MSNDKLLYDQMETSVARDYMEGKISYEEMLKKLIEIEKRQELSDLLDSLIIINPHVR